nr:hypothetical protein Itr_chr02CG08060 [Ipomoea trifida]
MSRRSTVPLSSLLCTFGGGRARRRRLRRCRKWGRNRLHGGDVTTAPPSRAARWTGKAGRPLGRRSLARLASLASNARCWFSRSSRPETRSKP